MAEEIKVVLDDLDALRTKISAASVDLEDVGDAMDVDLSGSPKVSESHKDFSDEWDETRKSLVESLDSVADALRVIAESFEQSDKDLAEAAENGGGS